MARIIAALDWLDELQRRLCTDPTAQEPELWAGVEERLDLLVEEAKRQETPFRQVRTKAVSLRHHFGMVMGKQHWDGHPITQHLAWIMEDLKALRSNHCLGPALAAEKATAGASDTMH